MKTTHYDVFVIGSGIAGQTVAKACIKKGLSVAMADKREFGGTCAIRGCDPKKIMMQFADLLQHAKQLEASGIAELPKIKWKTVQKFKSQFTNPVPKSTEEDLSDLGIVLYHQSPKFISETEMMVEGKKVSAETFVIATGYVPRELQFDGAELLGTSDDILNLKKIPKSATFIGSGYVGMEFCYMLSTLGCKVTVLEVGDRALSQFDAFLVDKVVDELKKNGVKFIFNAETLSVKQGKKKIKIKYQHNGKTHKISTKAVFNTSGRVPATALLELDKANITADDTGVLVNDFLQSISHKNVYACGDVSSKSLPLTPLSGLQGYIVAHNIINGNQKEFQEPLVPSVVFTQPNLASVGYSEAAAKARYKNVKVYQGDAIGWYNAKKEKAGAYAYKILANERTNEIVGAHLLSTEANETINVLATAINNGMTVDAFKKMIFTYPSYSNDLKSMMKDED